MRGEGEHHLAISPSTNSKYGFLSSQNDASWKDPQQIEE